MINKKRDKKEKRRESGGQRLKQSGENTALLSP